MSKKIIINPFSVFFMIILVIMINYGLGWSYLNQPLTIETLLFFGFILISLVFFSYLYNRQFPEGTFVKGNFEVSIIPWTILAFASMIAEFIYEKTIPIVEILILKTGYNYVDFEGIPVFHVFAMTFVSFVGLYLWSLFLTKKKWNMLLLSAIFVSYPMLLFNRGGFIMNMTSMFFIYIFQRKTITIHLKNLVLFLIGIVLLLYVFGLFGNIRSDSENAAKDIRNSSFILRVGKATKEFKESPIPDPFFWGYLYASTPIANLQNMTEKIEPSNDVTLFITQTVMPDFLGKRVEKQIDRTVQPDRRSSPVFNVSTMFISAYKTLGYLGMLLTYFYYVFFIFGYSYLMNRMNTAKIVGIAVLFTITIFNMFDNMLIFSGLSFQLIYPIIFWVYKKL